MIVNSMGEFVTDEQPVSYAGKDDWRVRALQSLLRTGKLRYCNVCGRVFKPRDARNVYCGFKCKQEANRYRAKMRGRRLRAQ